MKYIPLIWAGLWRKRTRTTFTLLSVLVAFMLFGLLQGVNAAFSRGVQGANLNRLYVENRVTFTESLHSSYLSRIEAVPGVSRVAYASWFGPYYQDPKNFIFSFPVDPDRYFAIYPEYKLPREQLDALIHTRTGAVVGARVAEKYGWKIGDRIPLHSTIWTKADGTSDWSFDLVGIYDVPEDPARAQQLLFNYTYFDEGRSFGKGTIGWYIVQIADPAQAASISRTIDNLFANSSDETKTLTEKENAQSFLKQLGDINFMVTMIIFAVFFTLLFLTGNTMMQSVRERIPELAVLKTLGFSDHGVLAIVLAESALLCVIAAMLGLGAASLVFPMARGVLGIVHLPWSVLAIGFGLAIVLALVSGGPPAWRARSLDIVDALARGA